MLPAVIVIDTAVPRGDVTLTAPAAATLHWRLVLFPSWQASGRQSRTPAEPREFRG